MPASLLELIQQPKLVAAPAGWTKVGKRLNLKLPLEIGGVIEEEFYLRGKALVEFPERAVTFQLDYHGVAIPGGTGPLTRFEWRPLRPHNNKGLGPKNLRFIDIPGSHIHLFCDNWDEAEGAMRDGNLPVARPVDDPLDTFKDCLDKVTELFRVDGVHDLPQPEWATQFSFEMKK